LYGVIVKINE